MKKLLRHLRRAFTFRPEKEKTTEPETDTQPQTFSQFLYTLPVDDFKFIKANAVRTNRIFDTTVKDLKDLSFELVKIKIPDYLQHAQAEKMIIDILKEAGREVTLEELNAYNPKQLLYFTLWVMDALEEINEMEMTNLQSFPEPDMVNAGINELNQFGILNTIDSLAKGDILKWDLVVKKPYYDVFTKLLKDKKEAEFNKRYTKLISQKR